MPDTSTTRTELLGVVFALLVVALLTLLLLPLVSPAGGAAPATATPAGLWFAPVLAL